MRVALDLLSLFKGEAAALSSIVFSMISWSPTPASFASISTDFLLNSFKFLEVPYSNELLRELISTFGSAMNIYFCNPYSTTVIRFILF